MKGSFSISTTNSQRSYKDVTTLQSCEPLHKLPQPCDDLTKSPQVCYNLVISVWESFTIWISYLKCLYNVLKHVIICLLTNKSHFLPVITVVHIRQYYCIYSNDTVNVLLGMCWLQGNSTPLDYAIQRNNTDIINYFIIKCQQDTTKIKQVCNYVALFLIVML